MLLKDRPLIRGSCPASGADAALNALDTAGCWGML